MRNRIIFFSGGIASFVVADWVKENHPQDNIILLFTDTLFEDEDLYRFINEASDKMKIPMLTLIDGRTPLDLMEKDRFIYNSRIARCSIELKVKPAKKLITKGIYTKDFSWRNKECLKSQDFLTEPILYFGIGFEEMHRQEAIVRNWQPYETEMPLINNMIDKKETLEKYNIKQPRLYDMGFAHNNCKGRCIKGGQGHWVHLLEEDYVSFSEMRDFELVMSEIINAKNGTKDIKYSYLKKRSMSYQLQDLEKDYRERPKQIDMFDIGTCGCFVDEENKEEFGELVFLLQKQN